MAGAMSDVTGYRSDGGMMGGDASVAPQVNRILSSKLPLLNAPGTVIENTLYYDVNSSSVSAVELQNTFAKDKISLTTSNFGSTPTGYIPSVLFANTCFVQFELPDLTYEQRDHGVNNDAYDSKTFYKDGYGFCIPHMWGFHVIRDIILYMGASSIAQIQISGYSNWMFAMACAETNSKRQAICNAAGMFLCNYNNASYLGCDWGGMKAGTTYVWKSKYIGDDNSVTNGFSVASGDSVFDAPYLKYALVPIRLPFSSVCALEKRISMDTKLSTQPIQITLALKTQSEFMELPKAGTFIESFNAFSKISYVMWQQELSDKSLSVRNELLAMPQFNVGYPFQYAQSYPKDFTAEGLSSTPAVTNVTQTLNLSSIINSDLTTFMFMVTCSPFEQGGAITTWQVDDNRMFHPLRGLPLLNMELKLNGQRYFNFDEDTYLGANMANLIDNPFPLMQFQGAHGGADAGDAATGDKSFAQTFYYELNNSRIRSIINEAHMQNTARFTNQTWQLTFALNNYYAAKPLSAKRMPVGSDLPNGYRLQVMYLYNAVFLIGGDGGTTKLITN